MKRIFNRIISVFLAIVVSFSLLVAPVAYAVIPAAVLQVLAVVGGGIGIWEFSQNQFDRWKENHPGVSLSQYLGFTGGVTIDEDGFSGNSGTFESDVESQYQTVVSSLPAQGITSTGSLLWSPSQHYYTGSVRFAKAGSGSSGDTFKCSHHSNPNFMAPYFSCGPGYLIWNGSSPMSGYPYFGLSMDSQYFDVYLYDTYPVTGTYTTSSDLPYSVLYTSASNNLPSSFTSSAYFSGSSSSSSGSNISFNGTAGSSCSFRYVFNYNNPNRSDKASSFSLKYDVPVFTVVPSSGAINVTNDTTYNTNSRTGSITGDYGVIGDNNEVSVVNNTTIVNEADGEYTNPATGNTLDISGWTYDYSDRSYNLTLDNGDTSTVTYGDEYVTIEETINNVTETYEIYYVIPEEETQDPDPTPVDPTPDDPTPSHTHDYTSTITQQPTCTVPGVRTYSCECGDSYTESIPAPGHNWQVKTSVQTQYDANGDLVTQGYTIFRCSVCGEEYRADDGAVPSTGASESETSSIWSRLGSLLGSIFGGIFNFLISFLEKVVEALSGLGEIITGLFTSVVDLFSGFTVFLAAVFPFLPEEFTTILTLALILLVAAGIIRRFLR